MSVARISVAFPNVPVLILNVLHLVHATMTVSMAAHVKMEVNFVYHAKKNLLKATSYNILHIPYILYIYIRYLTSFWKRGVPHVIILLSVGK